MKGAVFALLCAVALASGKAISNTDPSQAPAICAAAGSDGVLVAHETCNRFYKCAFGVPVAIRCPNILMFDIELERCEWPQTVDCGDRVILEDDEEIPATEWPGNGAGNNDPSQAPAICAAEGSDHVLIAHENCHQFYQCWAGLPVALICPPHLYFDANKDYCDFLYNVDCGNRLIPDNHDGGDNNNPGGDVTEVIPEGNNHDDPSQAPALCAAVASEGLLVAHEYCNQFYKCSHGLPVALRCPGTLLFSPKIDRCEWPENVDCGNRTIPDVIEEGGNEWTGNGAGNDDPSKAPAICAAEGSDHIYIAHENCNQYYKCWAGLPVALDCQPNFLFNPLKDYCDWPSNVDCGNRLIPDNSGSGNPGGNHVVEEEPVGDNNDDPSQAPAICAAPDSNGVLVAHENCNQFYLCSFGAPVALTCVAGLLFDPTKDRCEWANTVECGDRVIPGPDDNDGGNDWAGNEGGGNDDPSQAPAICAAEGSDNVMIAHENCNQYYQCWAGRPVSMSCPPNLYFKPSTDYCDVIGNVECGDRIH